MKDDSTNKFGSLNLAVLVLSVYVLGALIVDTTIKLPEETSRLLNYIDFAICIFFFVEFCIRLYHADSKMKFMRWGWIDLVSSIPMINFLRFGRVFRLIRLFRILRAFRTTKEFVTYVFRIKAQGAFTSATILAILLIIFSSIAILQVENAPDQQYHNSGRCYLVVLRYDHNCRLWRQIPRNNRRKNHCNVFDDCRSRAFRNFYSLYCFLICLR